MRIRTYLAVVAGVGLAAACAKGNAPAQAGADTTARSLTLAPGGQGMSGNDRPAAAAERKPAPPPAPTTFTAPAGTFIDVAVAESISSEHSKPGQAFSGIVVSNVRDAKGNIVIPQGSTVHGTVTEVKSTHSGGQLTLAVSGITVRGKDYALAARIDSVETQSIHHGVTGGDVAKTGAGAVVGAVLGRVIGGNAKGAVIGGVVGAGAGAGVAAATKQVDIVLPKGGHINLSLTAPLTVRAR